MAAEVLLSIDHTKNILFTLILILIICNKYEAYDTQQVPVMPYI